MVLDHLTLSDAHEWINEIRPSVSRGLSLTLLGNIRIRCIKNEKSLLDSNPLQMGQIGLSTPLVFLSFGVATSYVLKIRRDFYIFLYRYRSRGSWVY